MKITNVKFFKVSGKGPVLAFANIILDNKFIIRGIALVETEKNGRFISMPSRKLKNGKFRNIFHPLNTDIRKELTTILFNSYDNFINTIN